MTPPIASNTQSLNPVTEPEQRLRALLVDDDDFQRRVINRMLETRLDIDVVEADGGQQALDLLASEQPEFDLILCDLDMPVMDGLAFIRHLQPLASRAHLLLLSGCETSLLGSALAMCEAYGLRTLGALQKPLSIEAMQALLRNRQARQAHNTGDTARPSRPGLEEIIAATRKQEFEAYFQPKVCAASGRVVAAEALARWRHPQLGLLPPYPYFIGQLEQTGNIGTITDSILTQAVAACRGWQNQNLELSVSVNLSQQALQADFDLADRISEITELAGLHPSKLILEITETAAATNIGPVLENLARLRIRGFQLSIDDFGTGYSSLEQLARVAFTELKIDRSFVAQMLERADARTIISSSIDMAGKLGIRTVAEGVESREEWDLLRAFGCDELQGYYLGRPMPADAFRDFARTSRR